MTDQSIERLRYLCEIIPPLLTEIPQETFSSNPAPNKWSKKEILGHLIDSATNNHQRFVRSQFENIPPISYDQNKWNECSRYNEIDTGHLIEFWRKYNLHLIEVVKRIPKEGMQQQCFAGGQERTIEWLFDDYVVHHEHHLRQIVEY